MNVANWLQNLGLEQYEAAFRENGVNAETLRHLTADDLKDLGVAAVGHRRQLLVAIAAFQDTPTDDSDRSTTSLTENLRASETTAERRPLSVMFCDLIGSTALSSRLDPEDLREVIRAYQGCVASTIQKFDGFIARYVGDGVLIYFGWPEARETDAERAVRAGLAVAAAVSATPVVSGEPLRVRIGIATGLVVIGEPIGSGDSRQQTAVGETPNLAARLQSLAVPNKVVIDAATRRQVGGLFECEDLGPVELKGLADPVPAWRVVAENRAVGQFEALRSGTTPLVGRDEEMELLLRRWTQAKAGNGRMVLISAEPGVGKSRLAEALAERIAAEPHTRLRYFCSPHHQDSALYPVIAQMERAAGFQSADDPSARLAKLQSLLVASRPLMEDAALIAELHALPSADLAPPLDVSPQRKKEKTFEALLRQVEGLARQHPVLMVFDDIHWIDPSSRELLERLIERVGGWPVLLLTMFRPEIQPPWLGQPHVTMLTLARLDRRDTAAMVTNVAGNVVLLPEILDEIAERTDGVPLFVEELTKAVLEAGATAALSTVPYPAWSVPVTLHASLMARLDRLGPAAKEVAQTGAAIGREFGFDLISSVTDLPEPQLQEALNRLTNAGLLFARGTPSDAVYTFKHALVQDVAYGSLLRNKRRELHKNVVRALEEGHPSLAEAQPEILARHCTHAGLIQKAIANWLRAGEQGIARSAMVEAIAQMQKGLDLLRQLPDGTERDRQELTLQLALGGALIAVNGYMEKTEMAYVRARQLCEQLDDKSSLSRALWGNFIYNHARGEINRSHQIANDLLSLAEREDDKTGQLAGHRAVGDSLLHLGRLASAREHLERGVTLSDPMDHRSLTFLISENPRIASLSFLSLTLALMGFADQALARTAKALEAARDLSHPISLAFALSVGCRVHCVLGNIRIARQLADELIVLTSDQGFAYFHSLGNIYRGWVLVEEGELAIGIELLESGIASFRQVGGVFHLPLFFGWLSTAFFKLGKVEDGLKQHAAALTLSTQTGVRCYEAELHKIKGEFLLVGCDDAAAEVQFGEAIISARHQEAKLFELRASVGLARLWIRQGKLAEARDLLAPVYAWFTEGFDIPDLQKARELLVTLGAWGGGSAVRQCGSKVTAYCPRVI